MYLGFPGASDGKESACNAGDPGSVPRFPEEGNEREWPPTPVFLPGEFHGQRSLTGYSSWGFNELDMTERLTLSLSLHFVILQLNIVITTYGLPFPCFIMSLREILHLGMPERKSF